MLWPAFEDFAGLDLVTPAKGVVAEPFLLWRASLGMFDVRQEEVCSLLSAFEILDFLKGPRQDFAELFRSRAPLN